MVALDRRKQLHSTRLQPEYADGMADFGPFRIEIGGDEGLRQGADVERRCGDIPPIELLSSRQRDRAGQNHRFSREESQVLGSLAAIARLVEGSAGDTHNAVAADNPIVWSTDADNDRLSRSEFAGHIASS